MWFPHIVELSRIRPRLFLAVHISVRQVHSGTILHVKAAAVICHSLTGLKCLLLCTHQGPLSACAQPVACKFVHGRRHSSVCTCWCVCIHGFMYCWVLEGQSQGAAPLSWPSLQTVSWASKQEATSRERNSVQESVTLDAMMSPAVTGLKRSIALVLCRFCASCAKQKETEIRLCQLLTLLK